MTDAANLFIIITHVNQDTENKHDTERSELQEKNTQLRTRLEESVAQVMISCYFLSKM